jgi:hypothetical protein
VTGKDTSAVFAMNNCVIRIRKRVDGQGGAEPYYPVELRLESRTTNGKISVAELANESVFATDPAIWRGRELGGQDDAAGGSTPNADFAKWLHGLFFGAGKDLAGDWDRIRECAADTGVRLVLDIEPLNLRRLRWEQIGISPFYPGRHPKCSVVRCSLKEAAVPMRDGPVRILIAIGSRAGDAAVQAKSELRALVKGLRGLPNAVRLLILIRPTRDGTVDDERIGRRREVKSLTDHFADFRPHIFHFIGHGSINQLSGQSYLLLHNPKVGNVPWTLDDMVTDLGAHVPRLVFLNACHTVDADPHVTTAEGDVRHAAWSMSETFIDDLNCRAVVGMHGAVRGDTAGLFGAAFYQALIVDGKDIDEAVTAARIKVDQSRGVDRARVWDWTLPYLRRRVLPLQVLGLAGNVRRFADLASTSSEYKVAKLLVDRDAERGRFLELIQPDIERVSPIVIVYGDKDVGKTDLLRSCLLATAIRGRPVKYVNLNAGALLDDQSLLRYVCDGRNDNGLINKPLPDSAMASFYRVYNALIAGDDSGDPEVLKKHEGVAPWNRKNARERLSYDGGVQDQVEKLYGAFRKALEGLPECMRKQLADELPARGGEPDPRVLGDRRPCLIVLDQLCVDTIHVDPFRNHFVTKLLEALSLSNSADLVVVLVVRRSDMKTLGLDKLRAARVAVNDLGISNFRTLAMRFFYLSTGSKPSSASKEGFQRWKRVVDLAREGLHADHQSDWKPIQLRQMWEANFRN